MTSRSKSFKFAKIFYIIIARYCFAFAVVAAIVNTLSNNQVLLDYKSFSSELDYLSELVFFNCLGASFLFYLAKRFLLTSKLKPSFDFYSCEWRIENRPKTFKKNELCQWFVTRLEEEVIDEDKDEEPLVLKKVVCENCRCTSFLVSEEVLDDHLLWNYFKVHDRRGLDGKIFLSQETNNGAIAVRNLVIHLHQKYNH